MLFFRLFLSILFLESFAFLFFADFTNAANSHLVITSVTILQCGDGAIGGIEQCDKEDLKNQTCASLGFARGSLSCSSTCSFSTSQCIPIDQGGGTFGSPIALPSPLTPQVVSRQIGDNFFIETIKNPETIKRLNHLTEIGVPTHSLLKLKNDHDPNTQDDSTIYYVAPDGKRYAFPNAQVYFSWYDNFSDVHEITFNQMMLVPLGNRLTFRPGSSLVKFIGDPKVYAIDQGGVLRWIQTEHIATELYGPFWNRWVADLSETFREDYYFGKDVTTPTDFDRTMIALPSKDSDQDGLSNAQERALGTNPGHPDTDGDEFTDGEEIFKYRTHPLKADTDEDGYPDGFEKRYGYDPLIPGNMDSRTKDSDRDGLSDYEEVHLYHTAVLTADTDGDGVSDRMEIKKKTDPLRPPQLTVAYQQARSKAKQVTKSLKRLLRR